MMRLLTFPLRRKVLISSWWMHLLMRIASLIISRHESCIRSQWILETLSWLVYYTWLIWQVSVFQITAEISIRSEVGSCCHSWIRNILSQLRGIWQLRIIDSTHWWRVSFKPIAFEQNLIFMEFWIVSVRLGLRIGQWIMKAWALCVCWVCCLLLMLINHFWLRCLPLILWLFLRVWMISLRSFFRELLNQRWLQHAFNHFLSVLLNVHWVMKLLLNLRSKRWWWVSSSMMMMLLISVSWRARSVNLRLFI